MEEKESEAFFIRDQTISTLNSFLSRIVALSTKSDFEKARNGYIQLVLDDMRKHPSDWDVSCQINIGWIGNQFISRLSDDSEDLTKEKLDDLFSMCFRFLFELYLSIKNDLSMDFERARRFAFEKIDEFESHARVQIEYAIREMPISLLKSLLNNESIKSIKNFNELSASAEKKKNEWDLDLEKRENRVTVLKENLHKLRNCF